MLSNLGFSKVNASKCAWIDCIFYWSKLVQPIIPCSFYIFSWHYVHKLIAVFDACRWLVERSSFDEIQWVGATPFHHSIVDSIILVCSDVEGVVIQSGGRADFLLSVSVFFFLAKNHQKATQCFEKGIFCSLCFVIRLWVRSLLDWIMMILTSEFALYVILYSAIWCMNVLVLQAFYARCCGQNSKILQFSCWLSKGSPVRLGPLTLEPLIFLSVLLCLLSSSLQVQICPLFCVGLLIRFVL
jgi:hypothetical protein